MRLPRDLSGESLAKALARLGYARTRQTGSHMRLTTTEGPGEHHVTVPRHGALRLGTLSGIIDALGRHFGLTRDEVLERVFGKS